MTESEAPNAPEREVGFEGEAFGRKRMGVRAFYHDYSPGAAHVMHSSKKRVSRAQPRAVYYALFRRCCTCEVHYERVMFESETILNLFEKGGRGAYPSMFQDL